MVCLRDAIKNSFGVGDKEEYVSMTRPYAETCYYKIDVTQQTPELVSPNRYWADYASYLLLAEEGGFISQWYQLATYNMNEVIGTFLEKIFGNKLELWVC